MSRHDIEIHQLALYVRIKIFFVGLFHFTLCGGRWKVKLLPFAALLSCKLRFYLLILLSFCICTAFKWIWNSNSEWIIRASMTFNFHSFHSWATSRRLDWSNEKVTARTLQKAEVSDSAYRRATWVNGVGVGAAHWNVICPLTALRFCLFSWAAEL